MIPWVDWAKLCYLILISLFSSNVVLAVNVVQNTEFARIGSEKKLREAVSSTFRNLLEVLWLSWEVKGLVYKCPEWKTWHAECGLYWPCPQGWEKNLFCSLCQDTSCQGLHRKTLAEISMEKILRHFISWKLETKSGNQDWIKVCAADKDHCLAYKPQPFPMRAMIRPHHHTTCCIKKWPSSSQIQCAFGACLGFWFFFPISRSIPEHRTVVLV